MRKAKAQNWLRSDHFHHLWNEGERVNMNDNTICVHGLKNANWWWR